MNSNKSNINFRHGDSAWLAEMSHRTCVLIVRRKLDTTIWCFDQTQSELKTASQLQVERCNHNQHGPTSRNLSAMGSRWENRELREQFTLHLSISNSSLERGQVTTLKFHSCREKKTPRRATAADTQMGKHCTSAALERCGFTCLDDSLAFQLDCAKTSLI